MHTKYRTRAHIFQTPWAKIHFSVTLSIHSNDMLVEGTVYFGAMQTWVKSPCWVKRESACWCRWSQSWLCRWTWGQRKAWFWIKNRDKFRTLADFERLSFESGHSRPGLSSAAPFLVYMARILVVGEGGQSSTEGWRPHRKVQTWLWCSTSPSFLGSKSGKVEDYFFFLMILRVQCL